MRSEARPRHYVARRWLFLMRPMVRYSATRDAYVLRFIGRSRGPVLRVDRRSRRSAKSFVGHERRGAGAA